MAAPQTAVQLALALTRAANADRDRAYDAQAAYQELAARRGRDLIVLVDFERVAS